MQGCASGTNLKPPPPTTLSQTCLNLPEGHLKAQKAFYFSFTPLSIKVNKRKIKMSEILKLLLILLSFGVEWIGKRNEVIVVLM